jgi:ribosomal protein L37AE/L43A
VSIIFYESKEELIEAGLLNKEGIEDICIGYTGKECIHCNRYRVELYKSGIQVCEKCGTDQSTGEYVNDKYYSPF